MSTAVQGNIKDLTGTAIITNCFVRFWLRGLKGNVPKVNGVALVAQKSSNEFYFDFAPNASGVISGTLYSNDVNISAGGQVGVTWYDVQVYTDGTGGAFIPYLLADGTTFDLTSATPITSTPVVANPTGDTTYARLDGGNQPFTGQAVGKNGTAASPSFAFASDLATGFFRQAASVIGAAIAGVCRFLFNGTGIVLGSGGVFGVSSNADPSLAASDTGLSRTAAKTLAIGNGTQGDATGTLNAATYQVAGVAQSGTGPLAATVSPALTTPSLGAATATSLTSGQIIQPAATALTIKDNQGGTRLSIPSGGVAQGTINNTLIAGGSTYGGTTPHVQVFTGNGTFTIPANVTGVKVTLVGGGGAGGGATAANNGGGGGSGGYAEKVLTGLTPGNTIAVTVGPGGAGSAGANGAAGTASSIASGTQTIATVTANGGNGGQSQAGNVATPGNGAAVSTGGDINGFGVNGFFTATAQIGGAGGSTFLGGGGLGGANSIGGTAGVNSGSGGGGAGGPGSSLAGGAGAAGTVIFTWLT